MTTDTLIVSDSRAGSHSFGSVLFGIECGSDVGTEASGGETVPRQLLGMRARAAPVDRLKGLRSSVSLATLGGKGVTDATTRDVLRDYLRCRHQVDRGEGRTQHRNSDL